MKINEVSKLTNLSQKTIRYYEDRGLITPDIKIIRNRNFRDYSEETIHRLISISTLRKLLFSVDEIKIIIENPNEISKIIITYEGRISEEMKQRSLILSTLSGIKNNNNICDIDTLSVALMDISKSYRLPISDISPNFYSIDPKEPKYNNQKEQLINTKHSLFAKKANGAELFILELLWNKKSLDFNAIAHSCMERGVFSNSDIAAKTIKRMCKRKLIQYHDGFYEPRVFSSDIQFRNFDMMVQTAYNGSPDKMIYTPPTTPTGFGGGGV